MVIIIKFVDWSRKCLAQYSYSYLSFLRKLIHKNFGFCNFGFYWILCKKGLIRRSSLNLSSCGQRTRLLFPFGVSGSVLSCLLDWRLPLFLLQSAFQANNRNQEEMENLVWRKLTIYRNVSRYYSSIFHYAGPCKLASHLQVEPEN